MAFLRRLWAHLLWALLYKRQALAAWASYEGVSMKVTSMEKEVLAVYKGLPPPAALLALRTDRYRHYEAWMRLIQKRPL
jgi:hypothetical protein